MFVTVFFFGLHFRYEVIETETDILLIMEYVSGGELFEYIVSHGKVRTARFFGRLIVIFSGLVSCSTR